MLLHQTRQCLQQITALDNQPTQRVARACAGMHAAGWLAAGSECTSGGCGASRRACMHHACTTGIGFGFSTANRPPAASKNHFQLAQPLVCVQASLEACHEITARMAAADIGAHSHTAARDGGVRAPQGGYMAVQWCLSHVAACHGHHTPLISVLGPSAHASNECPFAAQHTDVAMRRCVRHRRCCAACVHAAARAIARACGHHRRTRV